MRSLCTICSIDRHDFDRATSAGFDGHVRLEHNMWNYLYFMSHLRLTNPTEMNGVETHVETQVDDDEVGWFPLHKALSLNATEEEEFPPSAVRDAIATLQTEQMALRSAVAANAAALQGQSSMLQEMMPLLERLVMSNNGSDNGN